LNRHPQIHRPETFDPSDNTLTESEFLIRQG
jgi:hypothetical protein